jgi:hypothetical protein
MRVQIPPGVHLLASKLLIKCSEIPGELSLTAVTSPCLTLPTIEQVFKDIVPGIIMFDFFIFLKQKM